MNFNFQQFLGRKRMKHKDVAASLDVSMGLVGSWASKKISP